MGYTVSTFIISLYRCGRLRVSHVNQNIAQCCSIAHIFEESTQFCFGRGGDHNIEDTAANEEAAIDGSGGYGADLMLLSKEMETSDTGATSCFAEVRSI